MYPWDQELDWLMVFDSTHNALVAEAALGEAGIEALTVPAPHGLAAGCALAIAFRGVQMDKVRPVLSRSMARYAGLYRQDGNGGYVKLEDQA